MCRSGQDGLAVAILHTKVQKVKFTQANVSRVRFKKKKQATTKKKTS